MLKLSYFSWGFRVESRNRDIHQLQSILMLNLLPHSILNIKTFDIIYPRLCLLWFFIVLCLLEDMNLWNTLRFLYVLFRIHFFFVDEYVFILHVGTRSRLNWNIFTIRASLFIFFLEKLKRVSLDIGKPLN